MASLTEVVSDSAKRKAVIDDCVVLIDAEVADKKGVTGLAVKGAFKIVKGFRPGIIPMAMDGMLDDFSKQVDPFWLDCQSTGANPRSFFVQQKSQIANALLAITDGRASTSPNKTLVKAYNKLRPKAIEHIGMAMPRFADLVAKHAG